MQYFLLGPLLQILFKNWAGISLAMLRERLFAVRCPNGCLYIFLLLHTTLWGLDCQTQQTNEKTILSFRHNEPIAVAELEAPANSIKIFLKLTGIDPLSPENDPQQWQLPSRSAVLAYRLIPYNKKTLLVIDLLYPVQYQISATARGFQVILKDAILRDPVEYDYVSGLYRQRHGDLDQALKYYQKVLSRRPHHPYAPYKIGQIRLQWEDYREAEVRLKAALKSGCDSVGVYKTLANLYRIYGNTRMAQFYENEYRQLSMPTSLPGKYKNESASAEIEFATKAKPAQKRPGTSVENVTPPKNSAASRLFANPWFWAAGYLGGLLFFITAVRLSLNGLKQKQVALTSQLHKTSVRKTDTFAKKARERSVQINKTPTAEKNSPRRHQPHIAVQPGKAASQPARAEPPPARQEKREADPQTSEVEALINALLTNRSMPAENKPAALSEFDAGMENLPLQSELPAQTGDLRAMAQRMNLGVGEIELALKLSALHHQSHRIRDVRQQILTLHSQDLTVDEIARKTGLGKGEIELFLRLINSA